MRCFAVVVVILALSWVVSTGEADYAHQDAWAGTCTTGKGQSPININSSSTTGCTTTNFYMTLWDGDTYVSPVLEEPSNLFSAFPSSTISIIDADGDLLEYQSAQYHIHAGGEHQVNGKSAALELHLVHTISPYFTDPRNYAVVGLLFDVDQSSTNNLFDQIDFTVPQRVNFKTVFGPFMVGQSVYHYRGSLTTPTCGEVVNWYVVQNRFGIRQAQLSKLTAIINNGEPNARSIQPLNGRTIWSITPDCASKIPNIAYNINATSSKGGSWLAFAWLLVLACLLAF